MQPDPGTLMPLTSHEERHMTPSAATTARGRAQDRLTRPSWPPSPPNRSSSKTPTFCRLT